MTDKDKEASAYEPVPDALRDAALRGKLVIFVGAGASRLAGCPGWKEFADGALEQLRAKDCINHAELAQLSTYHPKTRLSIAKDIASQAGKSIDYKSLLEPKKSGADALLAFKHLVSIGTPFVTTNFDLNLSSPTTIPVGSATPARLRKPEQEPESPTLLRPQPVYRAEDLHPGLLYNPGSITHLHGSVEDMDSMIISTRDYLLHYNKKNVVDFLDALFSDFTVLFVGYGLDELEILDHLFVKRRPAGTENAVGEHYLLFPMFSFESQLFRRLRDYYRTLNVELVKYHRDVNNYDELTEVVARWSKEINYRPPGFSEKAKLIENAFNG